MIGVCVCVCVITLVLVVLIVLGTAKVSKVENSHETLFSMNRKTKYNI